jgi:hypothetical protein
LKVVAGITSIAFLQNMMNPLYSQSYAHYNTQPQSLQPPPQ